MVLTPHCCRNLSINKLTGTIPSSICPLLTVGSLGQCYLQNNDFSCPLPCGTAKLCEATCTQSSSSPTKHSVSIPIVLS